MVGPAAHICTAATVISFILVFITRDGRPLVLASLAGRFISISIVLSCLWNDGGDPLFGIPPTCASRTFGGCPV